MSERVERQDEGYERRRQEIVWNDLVPDRYPAVILRPANRSELAEAVRSAASTGHRVSVKSGGHNWLGSALRDEALLLDLGGLSRVEVDVEARRATVEPGATHKILADAIVPHGLAFPIGHCPSVGLGGFLMAGGTGWNMHQWGPGTWNVVGADIVTASGEEIYIDESSQPQLFWALRGGSAGFPGLVTRFHLKLYPLPVIRARRVAFPLARLEELVSWTAERLAALDPGIEISLVARRPAGELDADPRANVVATGFGSDVEAATSRVETALASLPGGEVSDSGVEAIQLNDLEGEGGWQEGLRYAADTCWVSERYDEVGRRMAEAIEAAPSPHSRAVLAFGFMPESGPEVAFTRFGDLTVNVYATWESAGDDHSNVEWVRRHMRTLDSFKQGHYIGETDLTVSPSRLEEAYPDEKLERLRRLIAEHDPDRRFHGFVGED